MTRFSGHLDVNVQDLDCDFYAFSSHKVYGPTGIGVLYGKQALLDAMPPYQGGGDMILSVSFEKTTYNALPYKFEAGTPNISGVIGMAAALDYVSALGLPNIAAHEQDLIALEGKEKFDGLQKFLWSVHQLSAENRLSRFMFLARKPAPPVAI